MTEQQIKQMCITINISTERFQVALKKLHIPTKKTARAMERLGVVSYEFNKELRSND